MGVVLNLVDVQRKKMKAKDPAGAAVVEQFIQECDIAALLPFETLGTTEVSHRRTNSIPTIGFRQGRGTSFGTVAGTTTDKVMDAVFDMGAQVDADKTDIMDKEAGDIIGDRIKEATRGMTWTFLDYFYNGDHAVEPHGFEGVKVRLANLGAGQIVYGNASNAELDVRASASPSDATLYTFLDKIDETIDQCDGHTPDIAITSSDFIATLRSVLRRLGKYTERPLEGPGKFGDNRRRTSANLVNQPVLIYPEEKGVKWYDMGFKADQTTRVVGIETVNSVACRPVVFLKIGKPYLYGIQQYDITVSKAEKLDDGVTFRTTIDWPVGLHHVHIKSMSKLAGVRVA
jgi:hypothetical protein